MCVDFVIVSDSKETLFLDIEHYLSKSRGPLLNNIINTIGENFFI